MRKPRQGSSLRGLYDFLYSLPPGCSIAALVVIILALIKLFFFP